MQLVKGLIVLVIVAGVGYWAYMKFVKNEEVSVPSLPNVEIPDVNLDAFAKAEGFFRAAKYPDAITNYKVAIQENKNAVNVAIAHFHLAQSYEESKQWEAAIKAYEDALKKYPTHEFAERTKKALDKLKLERGG